MDNTNANDLIVSKLKTFRGDRGKVALDNEVTIQGDNQRIIVAKPYAPGRSTAVSGRPVFGKNDESHPPKYQTRHISSHRRLISKQFESLSTYPIDAPLVQAWHRLEKMRDKWKHIPNYFQIKESL